MPRIIDGLTPDKAAGVIPDKVALLPDIDSFSICADLHRTAYRAAIVRMRDDERTKAYAMRRTAEGKTRREIVSCIKHYIFREIFRALCASPALVPAA